MPLLDLHHRPLHDLRISLIDRCNFRCPYCMPSDKFHHAYEFLNKHDWLSFQEIVRLVRIFVKLGVKKIRLTGGEPLLRPNIDELIKELSTIDGIEDLALTTNGSLLSHLAPRLKAAGLKRITVSLDSLDPVVFKKLSGDRGNVEDVLHGIESAQQAGFTNIKINSVIQRGVNDHHVLDLVRFARSHACTVRFIEYMDVGNQNSWNKDQVVSSFELIQKISAIYKLIKYDSKEIGETAQRYRFVDGLGEIGFISSVTHAFCGDCNRLRLSVDGKMYTCLFATHATDLKTQLRLSSDDENLVNVIRTTWMKRMDRYSELRSEIRKSPQSIPKVEMYHIGG